MEFDCVDDVLIFLTELDVDYCIAKVGEERANLKEIWEKEIPKEITKLTPNLFATENLFVTDLQHFIDFSF